MTKGLFKDLNGDVHVCEDTILATVCNAPNVE